jgi:hypothetical protein
VTSFDHDDPTQMQRSTGVVEVLQGDVNDWGKQVAAMDKRVAHCATGANNGVAAAKTIEHRVCSKSLLVLKAKEKTV